MQKSINDTDEPTGSPRPTFFLAGYQKTASTWLYHCLADHPEIFVPNKDAIHFFDIHHHKGADWYQQYFQNYNGESQIGDFTPSYMRFAAARQRMVAFNPDARIIVTLRNPINRAFSHYWHEKKKRSIRFRFEDCLGNNVDIFDDWIATGFYFQHLTHLFSMVPKAQVQVLLYEDLLESPTRFVQSVFEFIGVKKDFSTPWIDRSANKAWFRPTWSERWKNWRCGRPLGESEYDRGIDPDFRQQLQEVYSDPNRLLADLLGRDLSCWT